MAEEQKMTTALSKTRLHSVWHGMKMRCYNPHATGYENYGGRGIKICDEWLSFSEFYKWAKSQNNYDDTLTIERIDNNGDYCPNNCIWITKGEQNKNRRNTHWVTYQGKRYSLNELSKKLHFDRDCFRKLEKKYKNGEEIIEHLLNRRKEKTNGRTEK